MKQKLLQQRVYACLLLLLSALMLWLASTGTTPTEQDASIVLLTLPMALHLITTKTILLME